MDAFSLSFAELDARHSVFNKKELADVLGCDVSTVSRMLTEKGNPGRELGNVYSVEKWRKYFSSRGNVPTGTPAADELEDAKLRERVARAALAEVALQKARGDLLSGELDAVRSFARRLRDVAKREFVTNATNTIAGVFSLDRAQTGELYELLEKIYYNFCETVGRGEGKFEARDRRNLGFNNNADKDQRSEINSARA